VDAFLATVASRRGEEEPTEYHGSMPGPMARLRRFPRAHAFCFPRPNVIEKVPPKGRVHVVPFRNRRRRFDFHRESADQTDSTTLTVSTDSADSSPFKPNSSK
jgi:hypothetical protein